MGAQISFINPALTRRGFLGALAGAATALGGAKPSTDTEIERFLREAKVVRTKSLSEGITNSLRCTLRAADGFEHDAHFQSINEYKPINQTATGTEVNFRDTYLFNQAGYVLSRMLGLTNVPPSVIRRVGRDTGALTWWIDDVLMSEKQRYLDKVEPPDQGRWNLQIYVVRVFDELIYNSDRNLGNLLITKEWRLWMIDHTRAFRTHKKLRSSERLVRCERSLFEALKRLDGDALASAMKDTLRKTEVTGLMARRDAIIAHFEELIAEKGEAAILYDLEA